MPLEVISSSQLHEGLIFTNLQDIVQLEITIVCAGEYQQGMRYETLCVGIYKVRMALKNI